MRKMPRNPFQDQINAWNLKDIDEGIKTDAYLKKSSEPIPDDINNQVFPRGDAPPVNVLKPEELSMKDLLDQIQIQTILNNNTVPFVEKKIKSEVTQEMINQFKYESSKPVEINGTFYKFRPPGVELKLKDVPPPFPSEDDYKRDIEQLYEQELSTRRAIERRRSVVLTDIQRKRKDYDDGHLSEEDYHDLVDQFEDLMRQLDRALNQNGAAMASLEQDYNLYNEYKLEHDTQVDLITKENKKNLASYEDELKSRNTGMEVAQQPGESDEDYAQRMIDMGQTIVDPDEVETQAKLFLFNSMKDLTNEIMPPYKSEAVLNTIIQAGGYEKLQVIKDSWPSIKKLLIDTFGNVGRVESTDNIAQLMYNYSMKPIIRPPAPPPTSTRVQTSPTMIPTGSTQPTYSPSTAPSISSYMTKFKNPIEVYATSPNPPLRMMNPRRITTAPASYLSLSDPNDLPTPSAYPVHPGSRKSPTPIDISYYLRPHEMHPSMSFVRPHPTDIIVRQQPNLEPVGRRKPNLEPVGKRKPKEVPDSVPPPMRVTRSSSLKASEKLSIDLLTNDDLVAILQHNELPYYVGHTRESKEKNYAQAMSANLIPNRPQLEPRSVVSKMSTKELKRYLDSKGVRGSNGGLPSKQADREMLLRMYDRYATPELQGKGIDIKSRFAIVDGEIQSGNNNSQLMRDAKKLLKEMTQQKMITLYEAQSHMKHLRKINKI